jgi:hypothetical protein
MRPLTMLLFLIAVGIGVYVAEHWRRAAPVTVNWLANPLSRDVAA